MSKWHAMIGVVVVGAIVAATWAVGNYAGSSAPTVVIAKEAHPLPSSEGGFDWELAALVLTGLGTLALAFATVGLAWVTRTDVATAQRIAEASQVTAKAAQETNTLNRSEVERRPKLAIVVDEPRLHSQVETTPDGQRVFPCVRLVVTNAPGKRAAIGTRVLVDQYKRNHPAAGLVSAGSPSLGWPTAVEASDGSLTVFAGSGRPVNFGVLKRQTILSNTFNGPDGEGPWDLELAIHGDIPADRRHVLRAPEWIVRLVVGSDDGDAAAFDVLVSWDVAAPDPDTALDRVKIAISPVVEGSTS